MIGFLQEKQKDTSTLLEYTGVTGIGKNIKKQERSIDEWPVTKEDLGMNPTSISDKVGRDLGPFSEVQLLYLRIW